MFAMVVAHSIIKHSCNADRLAAEEEPSAVSKALPEAELTFVHKFVALKRL